VAVVVLLGAAFRLGWGTDIEFKYDEAWTFARTQEVGQTEPFPWQGMPTSAGFVNPGMSLWVFLVPVKLCGIHDPVGLARVVQLLNVAALLLLVWFAVRVVPAAEREAWLWAAALLAINPLAVLYQRKIWPPSVLPIFTLLLLVGWWHRDRRWGAFAWGLVGAWLGQIHLSGFFFAAAFAGWALLFDRQSVRWKGWLAGSLLGALTLIPWLYTLATDRSHPLVSVGCAQHLLEGKFWLRWATEPLGWSLKYTLEKEYGDFLQYPTLRGQPTHLGALLQAALVGAGVLILVRGGWRVWQDRRKLGAQWVGRDSPTAFTQNAAFWGFGILLTASAVPIARHYLWVACPLGFVWLARLALGRSGSSPGVWNLGRVLLLALCIVQGALSASFLSYVHGNQRPFRGDPGGGGYGTPYGAQNPPILVVRDW
jgi:hypothetical protein